MSGDHANDAIVRLVELAVYAPIGAAVLARDRLPELVEAGRERVEQRVILARFIGQLVVQEGRKELERRLAPEAPPPPASSARAPRTAPAASRSASPSPDAAANDPAPDAAELPVDDFESLAAGQVVARLASLDDDGLDMVEAFERRHRNRRTVLNRIAQLRSSA